MSSILPQNPWAVDPGLYTRVDGSTLHLQGRNLFRANQPTPNGGSTSNTDRASMKCHAGDAGSVKADGENQPRIGNEKSGDESKEK